MTREFNLKNKKIIDTLFKIAIIVIITVITILIVYPMIFVLCTSFKSHGEFIKNPFSLSFKHPENYINALKNQDYFYSFFTSGLVAIVAVVFQSFLASLTIFAIGVIAFKGSTIIFYFLLLSMYLSGELTTIPLFSLLYQLYFTGTIWSLLFPSILGINATGIFLGITYSKNIPKELHEASALDGASVFQIFWYVDFKLLKPVLCYIAITTFTASWNDFFWPFCVLGTGSKIKTVPLALINFQSQSGSQQGILSAALVIASLPIVVLFGFFSRYFMEGVSAGAVKG